MTDSSLAISIPTPLQYAQRPRRTRQLKWMVLLVASILAGFAGWRWGPAVWQKVVILYAQRGCLHYAPDPNQVVYESASPAAQTLLQRPGYVAAQMEVVSGSNGNPLIAWPTVAEYRPAVWDDFLKIANVPSLSLPSGGAASVTAVCFLGELTSPGGQRRLVVVECVPRGYRTAKPGFEPGYIQASLIVPGTLTKPPGGLSRMGVAHSLVNDRSQFPANLSVFAGQRDPADRSHFTIQYEVWGQMSTVDGRLDNAGNVTLTLRHPRPMPPDYKGMSVPQ